VGGVLRSTAVTVGEGRSGRLEGRRSSLGIQLIGNSSPFNLLCIVLILVCVHAILLKEIVCSEFDSYVLISSMLSLF